MIPSLDAWCASAARTDFGVLYCSTKRMYVHRRVNGNDLRALVGCCGLWRPWPSTAESAIIGRHLYCPAASKPKFNDTPIISSFAAVESRGFRVLRKTQGDVDLHTRRSASGSFDCGKHRCCSYIVISICIRSCF
jgi:hypothetical protein